MKKRLRPIRFLPVALFAFYAGAGPPAVGEHTGSIPLNRAEVDMEYRCIILATPGPTDQTTTLPEGLAQVGIGDTFYVEFWATDSGSVNTGIVSAYADLDYPEDCVVAGDIVPTVLFNLFPSGDDDGSKVDELGGSQLAGAVGVEPGWARVAYVQFTAAGACVPAEFVLLPAYAESSAYNRGQILPADISYGTCSVLIDGAGGGGACCYPDQPCADQMAEGECLASGGRYLGDGLTCDSDPDEDGVVGCNDSCPTSPAPAGVDSTGRPFGDLDHDCDVDLTDYAVMQENLTGP